MIALRVLALAGMGYGAYEGFRRLRAEKKAKQDAAAEPPSADEQKRD
jgi:threonine/homoserine/homoserine lactone efflux protein